MNCHFQHVSLHAINNLNMSSLIGGMNVSCKERQLMECVMSFYSIFHDRLCRIYYSSVCYVWTIHNFINNNQIHPLTYCVIFNHIMNKWYTISLDILTVCHGRRHSIVKLGPSLASDFLICDVDRDVITLEPFLLFSFNISFDIQTIYILSLPLILRKPYEHPMWFPLPKIVAFSIIMLPKFYIVFLMEHEVGVKRGFHPFYVLPASP